MFDENMQESNIDIEIIEMRLVILLNIDFSRMNNLWIKNFSFIL